MANLSARFSTDKTVNTEWLQNAMKSIGLAVKSEITRDYIPNLYTATSSGIQTSKTIVDNLRKTVTGQNNVVKQVQKNKFVKHAQTAYKNALEDIQSGNLNNEDRLMDVMLGDDFNFDEFDNFGDSGFSFGDESEDNVNVNVINNPSSSEAMFALSAQMQKNASATLKTNKANMDAMIAINSATIMQTQQIGSQIISSLNSINENIASIVKYNNSTMTKFVESSIAYYEKMGSKLASDDDEDYLTKKIKGNEVFNSSKSGGINFAKYKKYVAQQLKTTLGHTEAGMALSFLDDEDMLQAIISNPIGNIMDISGLTSLMIPKILGESLKGVEKSFSAFMPAFLHKLSDWGDDYTTNGMMGTIKRMAGKTFGVRIDRTDRINKAASIEKGPVPFDGVTKHAITEIITKELREQTSYLKAIATHYKIDVNKAKGDADVFDYKTGTYMKATDVTQQIISEIRDMTLGTMKRGLFGDELQKVTNVLKPDSNGLVNEQELNAMNAMIDELLLRFEKHGKAIKMTPEEMENKEGDYYKIMQSLTGDKSMKKILDKYIRNMAKTNPDALMDLSRTIISGNAARNGVINDIESNPFDYNLFAALGLDGYDIDDLMLTGQGSSFRQSRIRNGRKGKRKKQRGKNRGSNNATIESTDEEEQSNRSRTIMGRHISDRHADRLISELNDSVSVGSQSGEINKSNDGTLLGLFATAAEGSRNIMRSIINGSPNQAMAEFGNSLAHQFGIMWEKFNTDFLTPIKTSLFGSKDADGFIRDGMFGSIANGFKDASGMLNHYITGKSFKDSKGVMHEDTDDSVVSNLKKISTEIKNGIVEKLFGKKAVDEDGNPTGDDEKTGLLSGFKKTINDGLIGWQEALFGKKLDEEERKNIKETMIKNLNERMPSTLTGSAIGAGVGMLSGGSLLGFLVGGPIGGAALGTALGFASKSEKFQNWVFGEKDENGERTGGFITKNVQEYFKKNKGAIVGGSALGAVKGTVVGGGILGTLVGGPVAGAILGMSTSILLKSHMFNEFLFGDPKTGQMGVFDSFKSIFKRNRSEQDQSDGLSEGGKAVGMSLLGTAGGALTFAMVSKMGLLGAALTPLGPIGGALIGLGLSIKAQKNTFHEWLFGKKDENGNKEKEGILGQFRNMLAVSLIDPMKNSLLNFIDDVRLTVKYDILDNIRLAIQPVGTAIANIAGNIKDGLTGLFNTIGGAVKDNLINPIVKVMDKVIISPITAIVKGVSNIIWGTVKRTVTFPFKLVNKIIEITQSKIVKAAGFIKEKAIDPFVDAIHTFIIDPIKETAKSILHGIFGGIKTAFKVATSPLRVLGGLALYAGDKINGVGRDEKTVEDAGGIEEDNETQRKLRKKQKKAEIFNARKEKRERKIRTENIQTIARATNYQLREDTEENRRFAEDALGKKINWRIDAATSKNNATTVGMNEHDILSANMSDLSEEAQQTNILLRIYKYMTSKFGNSDDEVMNNETNNDNESNDNSNSNEDGNAEDSNNENTILSDSERIANEISNAGGIRNYFKSKLFGGSTSLNTEDNDNDVDNDVEFFERATTEDINAESSNNRKTRKINSLLNIFKGHGFAKGGTVGTDVSVLVGAVGPELVNLPKGSKIFPNNKPLAVYVSGMAKSIENTIKSNNKNGDGATIGNAVEIINKNEDGTTTTTSLVPSIVGTAKQNIEKAIDKGYTAEELISKKEDTEKKDIKYLASMDKHLENQNKKQSFFTSLWSSIFSKKGLITGLVLLGIPLLRRFLKNISLSDITNSLGTIASAAADVASFIGTNVVSAASHIVNNAKFISSEGGLGDSDTSIDKIDENIDRYTGRNLISGKFIHNEDGDWDHMSGANTKAVGKIGSRSIAKVVGTKVKAGALNRGINVVTSGALKSSDSLIQGLAKDELKSAKRTLGTKTTKAGSNALIDWGTKHIKSGMATLRSGASTTARNSIDNVASTAVTALSEKAGNNTALVVSNATEAASKNKGMLSKVVSMVTSFFDNIIKAVGKKTGKEIGENVASSLLDDVCKCVKKNFDKISTKVSGVLGVTAGLAATGVGLLAKEGTWIALGAINGATGAARLFRVDEQYVDAKMIAISTALGAYNGSTIGSITDIINELFCSITGIDMYSELATLIYNATSSDEKKEKLSEGQDSFKSNYDQYLNETLKSQYDTMIKSGIIDSSVSYEDYVAGVKDGTYKGKYKSFADYNDEKHKTIGSRIGSGFSVVGKGIKKGAGAVKSLFVGSGKTTYTDSKGNTYIDNGDGTYQVKSSSGEDLGFISKDALPSDATKNKKELGGIAGLIKKGGSAAISGIKTVGSVIAPGVKTVGKGITTVGKKIGDFLLDTPKIVWYDSDGNYYQSTGKTFNYYNSNGDKIKENISSDEVMALNKAGLLTKGIKKKESGLKSAIKTVIKGKIKVDKAIAKASIESFSAVLDASKTLWNDIKENGFSAGIKKFFKTTSQEAWFDLNGNYYVKNGNKYNYYNANNDLIQNNIDSDVVENLIETGVLTKGKIQKDSAAHSAVDKIKSSVKSAWETAKNVVSDGWNKFTNWLFSGSGSGPSNNNNIGTFNTNMYGQKSAMLGGRGRRIFRRSLGGRGDVLNNFPYFMQTDDRWKNVMYSSKNDKSQTIGTSGCGPTSMAMILKSYGIDVTPVETCSYSTANGYRSANSGTSHGFFPAIASNYGLKTTKLSKTASDITRALSNKYPVIGNMGHGTFTSGSGHYIVLAGQDSSGNIIVNDPVSKSRSQKTYPISAFTSSEGKNFWSVSKDDGSGSIGSTTASNDSTSSSTNTISNSASSSGSTPNIIETLTSFMGEAASRAFNGILTGNYDSDYSSFISGLMGNSSNGTTTSSTTSGSLSGGSDYPKYTLTSDQINEVAKVITGETGGDDIVAARQEASQMVNLNEVFRKKDPTGDNLIKTLNSGWYAKTSWNHGVTDISKQAVQDVIIGGKRTLPRYVIEHDMFPNDIKNPKSRSSYKFGDAVNNKMGSNYKFYTFFGSDKSGDISGYTDSAYEKYKNDQPYSGGFGGRGDIPYYSQSDPSWANTAYGNDGATMDDTGCGPTAMAMVTSGLTGQNITPTEMASFSNFIGTRDETGTNANFIDIAADTYGLNSNQTILPDAGDIYNSVANGPTVLLGQNMGGSNPYTNAGHYVVANGVDSNGNVNIMDPRGSSYNRKYNINDITNSTESMWGFGFGGYGKTDNTLNTLNNINKVSIDTNRNTAIDAQKIEKTNNKTTTNSTNTTAKWLETVKAVKKAIAAQKPGYSKDNWISITVGGITKKVRTDCSGLVAACLKYYGVLSDNVNLYSGNMMGADSPLSSTGFTRVKWESFDSCNPGDILVRSSHTEIYAGKKDGKHYVYNCGSSKSVNDPNMTPVSFSSYSVRWVPGGSSANLDLSSDGTTSTTTSKSSSAIEKIVSFMGEFVNRSVNGIMTGEYDTDWSGFMSNLFGDSGSTDTTTDMTTSDSTSTNSGSSSGGFGKTRRATIKPRIIKNNKHKSYGGNGFTINKASNIYDSFDSNYSSAISADRYINNSDNSSNKAIDVIIELLKQITGNTATTSDKLSLLENIKNNNVLLSPTNNTVVNNSSNRNTIPSNTNTDINNLSNTVSKNQRLAERIAKGI